MPNAAVRATAEGLPTVDRRTVLAGAIGAIAVPLTATPSPADDPPSEAVYTALDELIADFRFAKAAYEDACERDDALMAAHPDLVDWPWLKNPFHGDYLISDLAVSAAVNRVRGSLDEILPTSSPAFSALDMIAEALVETRRRDEDAFIRRRDEAGLTAVENERDAACNTMCAAMEAILDYRPRSVRELELRNSLFQEFVGSAPGSLVYDWIKDDRVLSRIFG